MALKDCFKKFGKALSEKDKAAITQMVADGMGEQEAVDAYINQLKAQLDAAAKTEKSSGDSEKTQTLFQAQQNGIGLFSAVEQAVLDMELPQWKDGDKPANAVEILAKLKKTKGVKKEELEQLDIETYLQTKDKFTRGEVAQYIRDNGVVIKEIVASFNKARDNNGEGSELVWDHPEVMDEPENYQHLIDGYIEDFENGNIDSNWVIQWSAENVETAIDYYKDKLSEEQEAEIYALLEKYKENYDENYRYDIYKKIEAFGFDFDSDIKEIGREDFEEYARVQAYDDYMDNPTMLWSEIDGTDMYIVGSHDSGFDIYDGNWRDSRNLVNANNIGSLNEAQIQAQAHAREQGYISDPEEGTKWQEYVNEERDVDNYRELKLTLPEVEGTFVKSFHFSDRNIVAFLRTTDRKLVSTKPETAEDLPRAVDYKIAVEAAEKAEYLVRKSATIRDASDGTLIWSIGLHDRADDATVIKDVQKELDKNNLRQGDFKKGYTYLDGKIIYQKPKDKTKESNHYFIDEFQSDWHQAGRKKGYRKGLSQEAMAALYNEDYELDEKLVQALEPYRKKHNSQGAHDIVNTRDFLQVAMRNAVGMKAEKIHKYVSIHTDEVAELQAFLEEENLQQYQEDLKKLFKLKSQLEAENEGVADAPFKDDAWISLGLKRGLVEAIEKGYDSFSWADSEMLADRWSHQYKELYENQYDKKMPSIVQKLTGIKPERFEFATDEKIYGKDDAVINWHEGDKTFWVTSKATGQTYKAGYKTQEDAQKWVDNNFVASREVGYWTIPITEELKEKILGKGLPLYQEGEAESRGSLSILPDGSRVLKRSHKGDKSTIPHELAHLFLEVEKDLERDFGRTENQAALLRWLGVNEFSQITIEHHEKFAETFEVYLQEGKAPSPELRETFSKFRTWISNVYKNFIKDPRFRADLSDESRYIFDRMFATEEQIEAMRGTPAFSPLFRSKEQAGMTDEQYAEYLKNPDKVKSRAQTRIDKKIMDQLRKIKSKEWAEEKSFIIEEELERLKETKIYLTIETLKTHPLHLETLRESLGIPAPKRGDDRFIPEPTDSILTLAAKMGGLDMGQFSGQGKPEEVRELGNKVRELMRKVESTDISKPQSLEKWIGYTPKSLQSFIISMGGFNIQKSPEMVAELKARDIKIPSLLTHPKQGELTHGVDDILLAVVDNGYFKATDDTGRISMSELVDAIERSVNEEPIYTMEDNNAINNSYREAQKDYEFYAEKGLTSKSTNQDIALAINAKGSEDEIDVEILKDKEKNNRFVGKPVFRKDSGMGKAEFVKLLDERGFGYFINESNVAYAIKAELEGQSIISPEGQAILDQRERDLVEKGSSLERAKFIEKYVKKHGRENGTDPELIAEWAGYRDVREMIEDVAFAAPIKQQAEKNAEQIMVAKYGDILNDDTIEQEVRAALENEEQAKLLLAEIKALGRKVGRPDRINREELKAKAKELIGTMKNSEIKPNKFYRAAMKAAERAGKAQSEEEQIQAKIQQLANHYLYKEALTAKEKLDRQMRYVKKMQTKKWRTTEVGGDYRRIIGLVSNMYDAKKEPMDDVMSALSWFNTQVENEAGVYANVLDHNLLAVLEQQVLAREKGEQFNPAGYQFPKLADLTVDEMQGLYEQLKHLRWLGGKIAEGQKGIDALERANFVESIDKNGGKNFKDDKGIPDKNQPLKRDIRHFLYKNISLLNMVRKLDGDFKTDSGMAFKKIFMDIQSANSKKIALHAEIYNLMKTELKDIYKLGLDRKKVDYKLENGGTIPLGKEHRFMLAMYWGTESSREAIIKGYENTYGLTENDVMNILKTMSPEELNTVNQMWKINEHLWPRLSETVIAHEGVSPAKLEPTPFEINGIKMTGGHQMLKYDSMDIDVKNEAEKSSTSSKIMPSKSGSAHSRIGSGGRPVLLELGNITRAMDDNIHYIAFADTGARLRSLLNAKDVKASIEKKHGVGFHKALVEQIDSITGNKQANGEIQFVRKALSHLRGAATARHLMYSVRNTVQQGSAIPIAMQEVGSAEFISSVMKFSTKEGRQENIEFIDSLSPYMADRATSVNREASENIRKLSLENTKLKKMWQSYMDYGFMPQTFVDSLIAYPTWLARYDQAMNEHGDQAKAISQADNSVSESVGSGADLYLGGVFQSSNTETIKAFTIFGSFFNMYLQRIYRDTEGMTTVKSKEAFYTLVSTPIIVSILSAAVIMDIPDDESDDEEWLTWAAKQYAKFMGGTVIFVRDIMSYGLGGFTPKTTFAGLIESGGGFFGNVVPSFFDDESERTATENLSDTIKFAASLFKIPAAGNVTRVLDYIESSEQGNEEGGILKPYQAIVEGSNKN